MYQRDYLSKQIESFADAISNSLRRALVLQSQEGITETEESLGELLELDPTVLLALAPESFVTMMRLSGEGEALSDYVAYALDRLADGYLIQGEKDLSRLRRQQARAVASAFGVGSRNTPSEFAELERAVADARGRAGLA